MSEPYWSAGENCSVEIPTTSDETGETATFNFILARRDGATSEMVRDTVAHYCYAVYALLHGIDKCSEEKQQRVNYDGESSHNRVLISYGTLLVKVGDRIIEKKALVFSEYTSAQDYVDHVWEMIKDDAMLEEMGVVVDESASPRNNNRAAPQPIQRTENGTEYFGGYNYKRRETDYAAYEGSSVAFDVCKLIKRFDLRDGSPYIEVVSSFDGSASIYPAHDLKIKSNRLEKVNDYTRAILERVLGGEEVEGKFLGVYYVFKPKDSERHYMVLTKLEDANIAHDAPAPQPAQPETQEPPEPVSQHDVEQPKDIPF